MRPWLRFWQEDRGGLLVVFLWMDRAGRRLVKQALKLTRSSWNLGKGGDDRIVCFFLLVRGRFSSFHAFTISIRLSFHFKQERKAWGTCHVV
jgi:hypothetical protein